MLKSLPLLLLFVYVLHASSLQLPPVLDPKQHPIEEPISSTPFKRTGPTIQLAIILDSSNSMDGLIAQTKSQIWRIINALAKANKATKDVTLQVALYEFGKRKLSVHKGYIQKLSPLTNDLDFLSDKLFNLRTNGGEEFAGWAIQQATTQLQWSQHPDDLKLIVIAGNESFAQGPKSYLQTIKNAREKNIVVNTIFCGTHQEGINLQWQEGAKLGNGVYMHINIDKKLRELPTPYDDKIVQLGQQLNSTYIGYGRQGVQKKSMQKRQDSNALAMSKSSMVERSITKSTKQYKSSQWDLPSAYEENPAILDKSTSDLPKRFKGKSKEEIAKALQEELTKRKAIQASIATLRKQRSEYLKSHLSKEKESFGDALISSLKTQVKMHGFTFTE